MAEKTRESVTEKIRKLLNLSKSENPHEAALAAKAAMKLMLEHKLSQADIDRAAKDAGAPGMDVGEHAAPGDFAEEWRSGLLTAIALSYFCRTLIIDDGPGGLHASAVVVGKKEDAEAVIFLYQHFSGEIYRLVRTDMNTVFTLHRSSESEDGSHVLQPTALAKRSTELAKAAEPAFLLDSDQELFCRGATMALTDRILFEKERWTRSSERALVLVRNADRDNEAYLKKKYSKRPAVKEPSRRVITNATQMGYLAGRNIPMPSAAPFDSEPMLPESNKRSDK